MNKWRNNIRRDSQRNPILKRRCIAEGAFAHTAAIRDSAMILRELRKWRSILVIAVQSSGADCASLQLFAACDLIREPMEAIRGVRRKLLQRTHISYVGWDSNKTAPVKNEVSYTPELADGLRKLGDLRPLARSHLRSGGKFLS